MEGWQLLGLHCLRGSVALLSAGMHPLETGWPPQQMPTCADSKHSITVMTSRTSMLGTEGSYREVLSRPPLDTMPILLSCERPE